MITLRAPAIGSVSVSLRRTSATNCGTSGGRTSRPLAGSRTRARTGTRRSSRRPTIRRPVRPVAPTTRTGPSDIFPGIVSFLSRDTILRAATRGHPPNGSQGRRASRLRFVPRLGAAERLLPAASRCLLCARSASPSENRLHPTDSPENLADLGRVVARDESGRPSDLPKTPQIDYCFSREGEAEGQGGTAPAVWSPGS